MASVPSTGRQPADANGPPPALPPLRHGERMDQKTFHARYEAMPPDFRAELIGGVVHVPSPLKRQHGRVHAKVIQWLSEYEDATPGTEAFDNASAILDEQAEPQPDACLLIVVPGLGQTRNEDDYITGAPELIVEVAETSEPVDLGAKRADYERAGVREYIVVSLRQRRVIWFVRRGTSLEEVGPGPDGVFRSEVFPGLWLDAAALLRQDGRRVLEVLRQGLATPEHAAFITRLAAPP
ncbi:MAG TPA: Uma2 family endonuclease [Gemmataceae bacterium]|nr:Uma2 family endonuclease [Gemmataceae bacterium]